jgi:hypothetical protein
MSQRFGPTFQQGYVVRDLEASLRHWTQVLGVGPFFLVPMPLQFTWLDVRRQRVQNTDIIAQTAIAYSGDMQIELILPGTAPSTYHEFLAAGREGAHHLGFAAREYDVQLKNALASGLEPLLQGELPGFRFAYFDTDPRYTSALVELIEVSPQAQAMFDVMKVGSVGWDGRDPIRQFTP